VNPRFLPWVKLAWVWILAVLFCVGAAAVLVWQTSGPMGRQGLIEGQIEDLEGEIARLDRIVRQVREERERVSESGRALERIDGEIFGTLDDRMTAVLREVGSASRDAGLLPAGFSYREVNDSKTGGVRFGISFAVDGTYEQIRMLLERLQASPQFLIIDGIGFRGEEDPRSQTLSIRLQVSTYLAKEELGKLRALIERTKIESPDQQPDSGDRTDEGTETAS